MTGSGWSEGPFLVFFAVIACIAVWLRLRRHAAARALHVGLMAILALAAFLPLRSSFDATERVRVVIIDVSRSMGPDPERAFDPDGWPDSDHDRTVVIAMGRTATLVADGDLPRGRNLTVPARSMTPAFRSTARLAPALELAMTRVDEAEAVDLLIVTDGGLDAAAALARNWDIASVTLHAPSPSVVENLSLRFVSSPPTVRVGDRPTVELEVSGRTNARREVVVELDDESVRVFVSPAAPSARVRLRAPVVTNKTRVLTARLVGHEAHDADPGDDVARQAVAVVSRSIRVVVTADDPGRAAEISRRLTAPGRVVRIAVAGAGLEDDDICIVDGLDLAAAPGLKAVLPAFGAFVGRGGVLLLVGEQAAFGRGGWEGTILDDLSPLRARPGDRRREVTVLIDRSGSMDRDERFASARRAVLQLFEDGLGDGDRLHLVSFGARADRLTFTAPADASRLREILAAIRPAGGTDLQAAWTEVERIDPPGNDVDSLIFLLSDGLDVRPLDMTRVDGWVATARRIGAPVSVFWYDRDPSRRPGLARLTAETGGRLVEIDDFTALWRPFLEATRRGLLVVDAVVRTVDRAVTVPILLRTRKSPDARVVAAVDDATPAVAWRRHGAGHVLAAPVSFESLEAIEGGRDAVVGRLASLVPADLLGDARVTVESVDGGFRYLVSGDLDAETLRIIRDGAVVILRRVGPTEWRSEIVDDPPGPAIVVIEDGRGARLGHRPAPGADLTDRSSSEAPETRLEDLARPRPRGAPLGLLCLLFAVLAADIALRAFHR